MKHVEGAITKDTKLIPRKEEALKHLKGKILDIGCGEGELLIKATLLGYDITGMDMSIREINTAKETAKLSGVKIEIVKGDLQNDEELPFYEETFDTIVMGEILEHLIYPLDILKKVMTYLKKDGQLIITTPSGFAHFDPDHKNFFFSKASFELLNKLWIFELLPNMWLRVHNIIDINLLFTTLGFKYTAEEKEYGDSKHSSLDWFVIVEK